MLMNTDYVGYISYDIRVNALLLPERYIYDGRDSLAKYLGIFKSWLTLTMAAV